jgi:hypothetical protein
MDADQTKQMLRIPDTLASWPWPRAINLHYEGALKITLNFPSS